MEATAMSISEFCVRDVVCTTRTATIAKAAALMRQYHVGDVLVVDEVDDRRLPVGIVTDRDIVIEVVAAGVDPRLLKVGDLLQRPIVTVTEDRSYGDTIRLMTVNGVRRMPVVDRTGNLVGIISVDDMLRQLAVPLAALAELPDRSRHLEMQARK
jgi:CBS domain-containing protein